MSCSQKITLISVFVLQIYIINCAKPAYKLWENGTYEENGDEVHNYMVGWYRDFLNKDDYYWNCGNYYEMKLGETGTIYSPDYPLGYRNFSHCIWRVAIQDPVPGNRIEIKVNRFAGERYNGKCSDYLEIRPGGNETSENGLVKLCDRHENKVIISNMWWMWIKFKSDATQVSEQSCWSITVTVKNPPKGNMLEKADFTAASNLWAVDGAPKCKSYQFQCPNMQCISMSYRCDHYNDCGCLKGCDEDSCTRMEIETSTRAIIGGAMGVALFIIIFLTVIAFDKKDAWVASKTQEQLEANMKKRRRKASHKAVKTSHTSLPEDK